MEMEMQKLSHFLTDIFINNCHPIIKTKSNEILPFFLNDARQWVFDPQPYVGSANNYFS